MNAATQIAVRGAQLHESSFFAPVERSRVDDLLKLYLARRADIESVAHFMETKAKAVLHFFVDGNTPSQRASVPNTVETLFDRDGAIAQLNSSFWSQALDLTDVYQYMPQARRQSWNESIRHPAGQRKDFHTKRRDQDQHPEWFTSKGEYRDPANGFALPRLPDFIDPTVSTTLRELLHSREKFFAERVDGIFRALSRSHVTNQPQGFGKRMIINGFVTSYDTLDSERSGYIADLRSVVAKFMGRDEPAYRASAIAYAAARRRRGEWQELDGGAMRLRAYKCGTAHLEVNPDIAWRLNNILAFLHPIAIPSEFRQPPKRKAKDFALFDRPLPFVLLEKLAEAREAKTRCADAWPERWIAIPNCIQLPYIESKELGRAIDRVMAALGGSETKQGWQFDYDALGVIQQVVCTGRIPDAQAHQFYPTPESLAVEAAKLALIGPNHTVLEPSAGCGDLADHLPKDQTTCVEVSALHCAVLKAKRYPSVIEGDFIAWADAGGRQFDRVVMNPPFSDGRWQLHLQRAMDCVRPGGRLVAILPASARGKSSWSPAAWSHVWSEAYANEFAGTSVAVVILTLDRT